MIPEESDILSLVSCMRTDVRCRDITQGKVTYVDSFTGHDLFFSVSKFYSEMKGEVISTEDCLHVCRILEKKGIFKVVDKEKERRPREFQNDAQTICIFSRQSQASATSSS